MLTQSHVLLSAALLGARADKRSLRVIAATVGALLPDISIFVMWGQARLRGITDHHIWSELYYSDFWQGVGAQTNSMPLFLLLSLIGLGVQSWSSKRDHKTGRCAGLFVAVLGASALLHTLFDLPLHHNDGHPHFWPFTNWIYNSPLSYWDPAHHSMVWQPIEILLSIILVVFLWRRFSSKVAKTCLVLGTLTYAAMAVFWVVSLGK